MAMPFWLKSSPFWLICVEIRSVFLLPSWPQWKRLVLWHLNRQPWIRFRWWMLLHPQGKIFSCLDTPRLDDAQPAEEPALGEIYLDTEEDLEAQLPELQNIMAKMGLENKPAPPAEAKGSEPLAGFVPATQPQSAGTAQSELLNLRMDKTAGTFEIEGWKTVIPPLPEIVALLPGLLLMVNYAPSSQSSAILHGRRRWWPRSSRSTSARSARQPTPRRWRSSTRLSEVDPWRTWRKRTRGLSLLWFVRSALLPEGSFSKFLLCKGTSPIDPHVNVSRFLGAFGVLQDPGRTWVAEPQLPGLSIHFNDWQRRPPKVQWSLVVAAVFCIWSGGLITWYLQHPSREPLASAVWWKCSVTPPLVLMGSWREPCWWRWCMWHQNRNPAAQANCIAKDVVLLQLPASEAIFNSIREHTHTHIYIYNNIYIYSMISQLSQLPCRTPTWLHTSTTVKGRRAPEAGELRPIYPSELRSEMGI